MSDKNQVDSDELDKSNIAVDNFDEITIGSLGVGLDVLEIFGKGATKLYKVWNGAQGDVDIIITNTLDKVITIQLISNDKHKKYDRISLKQGETAVQNLSSKAGISHTTKLQCEFSIEKRNFTIHVYGDRAGRYRQMKYEVREQGVYWLIDTDQF